MDVENKIVVLEVLHGSLQYEAIVNLRYEILRKPLNMHFTAEQLANESAYMHLGLYYKSELVACLMLVPIADSKIQMKQVAVLEEFQKMGFGKKLVEASEELARKKGYQIMFCHARDIAMPFYKALGYNILGEMFTEIGIPHYYLEKTLINAAS